MNDGIVVGDSAGSYVTLPMSSFHPFAGNLDGVHGRCAEGWAFDPSAPERILGVEIFDGNRRLGTAEARLFRPDLASAGIGDGHHAFRFLLPLELFDGLEHQIEVRTELSNFRLPGSPYTLKTAPLDGLTAFPSDPRVLDLTRPFTDAQFTILRSLQALTDALIVQNRSLSALLDRLAPTGAINLDYSATLSTEEEKGPLFLQAVAKQSRSHDYIFFSIIDWAFRIQRPQHLATQIAATGERVFYLSITFGKWESPQRRFQIRSMPASNVYEVGLRCRGSAPSIYAGFDDPAQISDLAAALEELALVFKLKSPVGVVQFPSWFPITSAIPGLTLLFDCLDHLTGFNNVSPRVVELEPKIIETADCVTVTSEFLADIVGSHRVCRIVRNGVDVPYFSQSPVLSFEPTRRPLIGYYGAIADWFDIELIAECAERNPSWQFALIGEVTGCDTTRARNLQNVEFLGEQPYERLTFYLYSFDVCIIPFKLVDLIKATNPVKVYEYLCAGKPVVATDMPELRLLPPGLVKLAGNSHEFDAKIREALKQPSAGSKKRKSWSLRQSWCSRAGELQNFVEEIFPRVSIIILCHNNLQFTQACLNSVLDKSDYPDTEVIMVDNASIDGTSEWLIQQQERQHSVKYIRSNKNLGFAGGNNLGIKAATGEIIILLNNDTYVTKGWVRDLIRPLLRDQKIGLAGPLTNNIGNEQRIEIAYSNMEEMERTSYRLTMERRREQYSVDTLAFFCVAIRKDVFQTIGYLDEDYTIGFFEDDDYCARARQAGFELVISDGVFVHHHLSASFDEMPRSQRAALMSRNRKLFESRWGPWKPHRYRNQPGFPDR